MTTPRERVDHTMTATGVARHFGPGLHREGSNNQRYQNRQGAERMHVVVRRCHVLENHFQTGNEASVLVSKKRDSISEHGNYDMVYLWVICSRIGFGVTTC